MSQIEKELHKLQHTMQAYQSEIKTGIEDLGCLDSHQALISKIFLIHIAVTYKIIYRLTSFVIEIAKNR